MDIDTWRGDHMQGRLVTMLQAKSKWQSFVLDTQLGQDPKQGGLEEYRKDLIRQLFELEAFCGQYILERSCLVLELL